MGRTLFGIILGLILAPLLVLGWFRWGNPPVAVTDAPLPFERQIVHVPLNQRIDRDKPGAPPIEVTEANLNSGAAVYSAQCAACHGLYGRPSNFAAHMYPKAPQLWQKHKNGSAVGVSDDSPGETYWKVANGIRLTGMPAFEDILSPTEIWQVSLLLANADKPLPPAALAIVRGEQASAAVQAPAPPKAQQK